LYRAGTSLVASIPRHAGILVDSAINDAVPEDEELADVRGQSDKAALQRIIRARNTDHAVWGFKYPMLWRTLRANQLSLLDRPRLIVRFRDPVSVAVPASLSQFHEPMRALCDASPIRRTDDLHQRARLSELAGEL